MNLSIGDVCLGRPLRAQPLAHERSSVNDHVVTGGSHRRVVGVVAEHVLVTTDGSIEANRAIPLALSAIRACGNPRVTLLCVLTSKQGTPVHALESAMARAHAEASLQRIAQEFPAPDRVTWLVAEGGAAEQIVHFVETHDVDLIVMASHGSDESQTWQMGGTTRKIVVSGLASVFVVPTDPERKSITSILIPLDGSARSECVLPMATKLAVTHDAELVLVHVVPKPDIMHRLPMGAHERELTEELTRIHRERAEGYLAGVRERLVGRGLRTRSELLADANPGRAIEAFASESSCDLILMCAHGSGCNQDERYGSITRRLIDSLVKPIWIVQDLPVGPMRHVQPQSGRSHAEHD